MFIDLVYVNVKGGDGGDGCTAFRREKFIPMGGPYGGNGGDGSDIIFKVDLGLHTLIDLKFKKNIKGKKGENGGGKNQDGKNAEDIIISVPRGTVITDTDTNLVLADLSHEGDCFVVAEGGRGGRGNTAFKTQSNPAPSFSENGEEGEKRLLKVELKLLADVSLVGFPSVGKSTIISKISNASPKIAPYHFTTMNPNLGVVKYDDDTFVVADLPGLIEGASSGVGLGDRFLKHIERTKLIAHVIDMSGSENRDPISDYKIIRKELDNYNKKVSSKEEIIIANKMDLDSSYDNLIRFKKEIGKDVICISANDNEGLDELIKVMHDKLSTIDSQPLYQEEEYLGHILYTFKKDNDFSITKENGVFVISSSKIEKVFRMTKFNSDEGVLRFTRYLRKEGIDDKLEEMGAVSGDRVRILDYEFEYRK